MKRIILKLRVMFLLSLFMGTGCDDDEYSNFLEGYVVGSFIADEVNADGQATGNKTERGYCILLEGSENNSMDFYSFNFPNALFDFPDEILTPNYNGNNCGPTFFPDSLKYAYKMEFKYQITDEQDKIQFVTGPCFPLGPAFLWEYYNQAIVYETTKN